MSESMSLEATKLPSTFLQIALMATEAGEMVKNVWPHELWKVLAPAALTSNPLLLEMRVSTSRVDCQVPSSLRQTALIAGRPCESAYSICVHVRWKLLLAASAGKDCRPARIDPIAKAPR